MKFLHWIADLLLLLRPLPKQTAPLEFRQHHGFGFKEQQQATFTREELIYFVMDGFEMHYSDAERKVTQVLNKTQWREATR